MRAIITHKKSDIEKNRHYEVDFMSLWSDEAGQRRDVRHPDVRVATLDLGKIGFQNLAHRATHIRGMWVPTVILESGRGVFQGRCLNTHMPFVVFAGRKTSSRN